MPDDRKVGQLSMVQFAPGAPDGSHNQSTKEDYYDQQENLRSSDLFLLAVAPNLLAAKCSNASLKGAYGYSSTGFTEVTPDISSAGFVPFAQTGLSAFDGNGKILSGTFAFATTTPAGAVFRGTFTGTHSVNGDCSGTAVVETDAGDSFNFDLVVLGPGKLTFINTDPNGFLSVYSFQRIVGTKEAE